MRLYVQNHCGLEKVWYIMFAFYCASSHVSFNIYACHHPYRSTNNEIFKSLLCHITLFQDWKIFQLKAQWNSGYNWVLYQNDTCL